ncbi:unnamed protein product [Soboliphyme baturini]|uniref:PH domain-containing protein n=1 Tax=Soboliphyme baturini TaxID=241478 RepID=A0A183IVX7_9BILA|nr:unnamed protein product [Soboliphyme baturini]
MKLLRLSDRQNTQGTVKINLVQIYGRNLFQTPAIFCRSSDSGTGSGTLEGLSDSSASATRKEKRRWKMKMKKVVAVLCKHQTVHYEHLLRTSRSASVCLVKGRLDTEFDD